MHIDTCDSAYSRSAVKPFDNDDDGGGNVAIDVFRVVRDA